MTDEVKEAIYNLQRFGNATSDPVTKSDIRNLIKWIVDLAEALAKSDSD